MTFVKNCRFWPVLLGLVLAAAVAVFFAAAQSRAPRGELVQIPDLQSPGDRGAYLGIQMEDVAPGSASRLKLGAERGVIVKSVSKGSPAEAARIQPEDVLLEYCGIPVISAAQLSRMIRETPPERTVDLVISRDGKKLNITAKLGEREDSAPEMRSGDSRSFPFDFRAPDGRSFRFRFPEDGDSPQRSPRAAEKPRLGVTVQPLTEQMAEFLGVPGKGNNGVLIMAVAPESPAASVFKAGDVILKIEDAVVATPDALARIVQEKDGKVTISIIRERKEMKVSVELPTQGRGLRL
jgi:serine protease Do